MLERIGLFALLTENHTSKEMDANYMTIMVTSRDKTHYTNQRLGVQIFIKSMTCKCTSG